MDKNAIELLDERIEKLKKEGVNDIKLYPPSRKLTKIELAQAVLNLMDAPTVEDPELF